MTRRSFLKRACAVAAGLAVGAELLTDKCTASDEFAFELKPYRGKGPKINPAWVNAKYEAEFFFDERTFKMLGDFGQHFYEIERAYRPIYVRA